MGYELQTPIVQLERWDWRSKNQSSQDYQWQSDDLSKPVDKSRWSRKYPQEVLKNYPAVNNILCTFAFCFCLGVSHPFASDTSSKWINQEGLGKRLGNGCSRFGTVNLTSEVIFFNETVRAASSTKAVWNNWVVCFKSVRSSPFMNTFLILSGISREISQGPKCPSQIWKCAVIAWSTFFPTISADALWGGLRDEPKERRLQGRLSHWWLDPPQFNS